ncbi:hypothetical protein HDU76_013817 [Blyttiomyces sp. JEL0837]|nr:hypothetical protein HDU76_013817 [Blyttiomyces sp. JEL0837]
MDDEPVLTAAFWLQYQNKTPVQIETHFLWEGKHRARPLSNVSSMASAILCSPPIIERLGLPAPGRYGRFDLFAVIKNEDGTQERLLLETDVSIFPNLLEQQQQCSLLEMRQIHRVGTFENPIIITIQSLSQRHSQEVVDWTISPAPEISTYDPSSDGLFRLDEEYTGDCGLLPKTLLLFPRQSFRNQMAKLNSVLHETREKYLQRQNPYNVLWILGPPGIGKSVSSMAFLSTIDRALWTITLIHVGSYAMPTICVRYCGGTKYYTEIIHAQTISEILTDEEGKNHIVFLDGLVTHHSNVHHLTACVRWLRGDFGRHRLVITSASTSRGKTSLVEDDNLGVEEFFVDSWQLDDYLEAVKHEDFYQSVEKNLDACETAVDRTTSTDMNVRTEFVKSKYYFAGGSAQFMFAYPTSTVITQLDSYVMAGSDVLKYIGNPRGDYLNGIVNSLFSSFVHERNWKLGIISQYAAFAIAIRQGPSFVQNIASALRFERNHSMDEGLLEMWLFASLRKGGVKLYVHSHDANPAVVWSEANIRMFDPRNLSTGLCFNVWLKPITWNQGGYDAVFFDDRNGLVRFVKAVREGNQLIDLKYISELLHKVGRNDS